MKIRRVPSQGLLISRLPASHLRLLQQIPLHADPAGSRVAEERLYQSPVKTPLDDTEDELVNDWNDHVLPDLRSDFARQIDCVTADLLQARREYRPAPDAEGALREAGPRDGDGDVIEDEDEDEDEDQVSESPPPGDSYELVIPLDHIESWYGALNQARLVMQARYNFPETESLEAIVALLASENLKPYLTSRFYTELQGVLLDLGMRIDGDEPLDA